MEGRWQLVERTAAARRRGRHSVARGARQFGARGDSGWCWGESVAGVWALCQVSGVDGGGGQVGVRRLLEDEGGCWKWRLPAEGERQRMAVVGWCSWRRGAAVGNGDD